ncbi:MAG: hypothetical protein KO202_05895 [Methanobacteriaceae archaeon]|jgi:hypothetical protein|nr:hypothetical protein [Methanobacteriaceae archaeon]
MHVFSDKNILEETGFGYQLLIGYTLSFIANFGHMMLFSLFFGARASLLYIVTVFSLASASMLIPMFPDY